MKKRYLYIILLICSLSLSSCSLVKNLARQDREDEAWDVEWDSEGGGKTIKQKRDVKHNNKRTTQIPKTELTEYCKDWIGTPHVNGGMSKQGVDCSGFVDNVYMDVYGISLPRQSQDIEKVVEPIDDKTQLKEGDLVFFNAKDGKVNHVGIYIKEDTFIHASSSKGVMISNLNEKYWANIYRRGGRHPELKNKKNKNKKA